VTLAAGSFASQGILAALYQRERTGRGQSIDIGLVDCQTSLLTYRGQYYLIAGDVAEAVGSGHVSAHPIKAFHTKTFDIVIDANTENIFADLCGAIGAPDMCKDPRFCTRPKRLENKKELYEILEKVFLEKTGEEWLELLEKKIPIAPINTVDKALSDPQTLYRDMVVEIDYGTGKRIKVLGNPIKMSEIDQSMFTRPPRLGEQTEEILSALLKYSHVQIKELRQQKII